MALVPSDEEVPHIRIHHIRRQVRIITSMLMGSQISGTFGWKLRFPFWKNDEKLMDFLVSHGFLSPRTNSFYLFDGDGALDCWCPKGNEMQVHAGVSVDQWSSVVKREYAALKLWLAG
jgi:hypothetical protein